MGPPDSYLASPFFPCRWRPSPSPALAETSVGRRVTRPFPSWLKKGRAALLALSQSPVYKDVWKAALGNSCQRQKVPPQGWKLYLQFCRHRCSSRRLQTYSAGLCLARNSSESLPLRSQLLRPSVYVQTIFGNENQRGQWLSSVGGLGEKTSPDL